MEIKRLRGTGHMTNTIKRRDGWWGKGILYLFFFGIEKPEIREGGSLEIGSDSGEGEGMRHFLFCFPLSALVLEMNSDFFF